MLAFHYNIGYNIMKHNENITLLLMAYINNVTLNVDNEYLFTML